MRAESFKSPSGFIYQQGSLSYYVMLNEWAYPVWEGHNVERQQGKDDRSGKDGGEDDDVICLCGQKDCSWITKEPIELFKEKCPLFHGAMLLMVTCEDPSSSFGKTRIYIVYVFMCK